MARILTFAYPGDLDTLTGGYLYDKRIIEALRSQGWQVHCLSLAGAFPHPSPNDLQLAIKQLAAIPGNSDLVIDGLALGAFGTLTAEFAQRAPGRGFVALVHHPLALESGISLEHAVHLAASESAALRHAAHVIVTSNTTRDTVESMFALGKHRCTTVLPGTERSTALQHLDTNPAKRPPTHPDPQQTVILSVGSVIPRKGHDVLVSALAGLKHLNWALRLVGDTQRDAATAGCLQAQIDQLGLSDRITLLGNLSQTALETQYQAADIFALASHYEGYGMAYAEAMLWGLPIVGTTGGAIAETASTNGSFLVEPGNIPQLRLALESLICEPDLRQNMAQAAWDDGQRLPDWNDSARLFANAIERARTSQSPA